MFARGAVDYFCVSGECGCSQDMDASPDAESEEAIMDWFIEEVADYEADDCDARKATPAEQVKITAS